jgi:hypothetical protein
MPMTRITPYSKTRTPGASASVPANSSVINLTLARPDTSS